MDLQERFQQLLVRGSAELHEDHPDQVSRPDLLPTPNVIDAADLALFFEGLDSGLVSLARGGRFNRHCCIRGDRVEAATLLA